MRLQNKRGSVLITLIVAMVLMAVLGAGIYSITTSSSFSELLSNKNDNAYQLAKSGIRYAANLLAEGGRGCLLPETTFQMQGGNSFTITIANDSSTGDKNITSKGDVNKNTFLAASRVLTYSMPPPPPGLPKPSEPGYYVSYSGSDGAATAGGTINGSIYGETVSIAPNSTITGNVISKTSITIGSGTIVSGRICSSNGDVTLRASSVNVGGPINANNGDIILQSGTTAWDNVFASGNVTLIASNSSVAKDINAGGDVLIESGCSANQNVYAGGKLTLKSSGSQVKMDVHTGGNVNLAWGTPIYGTVWAGGTISSPDTTNQKGSWYINQPVPPRILPTAPTACPDVPKPQTQTFNDKVGTVDIVVPQSGSSTITPGKYRNLIFNGGATLTIQAGICKKVGDAGCYYFNSFQGGKWGQTLRLDLSTGPDITIFSAGDIKHSGPVEVSTDGSTWHAINETTYQNTAKSLAKRVYWETHGNFQITTDNGTRQWFGTVLSKNDIMIPSGAWIIAALATVNGSISADANPTITYVLADFARDHW